MLKLTNITKSFDGQPVLRGVSLELAEGEIVALLGPSGCGKTTLLRIMAGLETADSGQIVLAGTDLAQTPVYRRGFGMVFQEYALFPHKNVFENVAFGLRMQQWDAAQIQQRVQQVLALVGLADFGPRPIHELSGGEQQRVALARSLSPAPRLVLLDEPLGALDRALRERLMLELRQILKQAGGMAEWPQGITAVYVTHDQAEAFAIADRILVMNDGRIEQAAAPLALYRRPQTPFVAGFLGMENLVTGEVAAERPLVVHSVLGQLRVAEGQSRGRAGQQVTLLIRPEAAHLVDEPDQGVNVVSGRFTNVSFRGRYQIATFVVESGASSAEACTLKLEFETAVQLPPLSEMVHLQLDAAAILPLEWR